MTMMSTLRRTATSRQNLKWIEIAGTSFGILGALLLAFKSDWSPFGFVLYLISNAFLIPFALSVRAKGLALMYVFYTITSGIGVFTWLIK